MKTETSQINGEWEQYSTTDVRKIGWILIIFKSLNYIYMYKSFIYINYIYMYICWAKDETEYVSTKKLK